MKFSVKNREKILEIRGEKLTLTLKGVISVSTRQKIMSIMSSIFSKGKMTTEQIAEIKDGKREIETGQIMEAFGGNILTVYEIASDIIVDWDAFDEEGNKLPIEPGIIALVIGDGGAMGLMTDALNPPTLAENSQNLSSSTETN